MRSETFFKNGTIDKYPRLDLADEKLPFNFAFGITGDGEGKPVTVDPSVGQFYVQHFVSKKVFEGDNKETYKTEEVTTEQELHKCGTDPKWEEKALNEGQDQANG